MYKLKPYEVCLFVLSQNSHCYTIGQSSFKWLTIRMGLQLKCSILLAGKMALTVK